MPQFFFHIRDGKDFIQDCEGAELPDVPTAIDEARQASREIAADRVRRGTPRSAPIIEIHDRKGAKIAEFDPSRQRA